MAADWTDIPNTSLEPDAPARSIDALALRDNPIAIAEGAAGAPRVEDPALNTTATNAGRDWVLARTALSAVGAVGTYAMLRSADVGVGATMAGSSLSYAGAVNSADGGGSSLVSFSAGSSASPPGTWRCMGFISRSIQSGAPGSNPSITAVSLFLRIS